MTRSNDQEDPEDDYRDDPGEFGLSSDLARTGTSGITTGGGPDDSSKDPAGTSPGAGNNAGSQEDWRGAKAAPRATEWKPKDAEDVGGVPGKSADPGQSGPDSASDESPAEDVARP